MELTRHQSVDLDSIEDQELISDICTQVVARLSGDYQDVPPDEIPRDALEEAVTEEVEDAI